MLQRSMLPLARSRPISGIVSTDSADSECESLQWLAVRSIWRLGGEFRIPFDDGIKWGWTTAGESQAHSSPTEGTGSRLA